ncbi:MAG: OmpA family protein [Holosporales bacterium]|jgi:peptidoglycan-associated lipoprotein|nr:OmpA family protein [Holosporales bacterium]
MDMRLLGLLVGATALLASCSRVCDVEKGGGESEAGIVPGSAEDFAANVPNKVYFEFDSSRVTSSASKRVESQAAWLKTYPATSVSVEGHTDIRGTAEYNLALGTARANSTAKALRKHGVEESRITVTSYGKERVADEGTSEEAHARNRRTETIVSH